ncbi:hypothetical protein Cni_G01411 [Canna indica]|uniref:Uncharacterized protein n=1 Tax=Canna indica TaxID=4628 RepID=A0AAQ3JQH2_9LILI|nr:hypothetical protein Cni_G01411 [Canna indica]
MIRIDGQDIQEATWKVFASALVLCHRILQVLLLSGSPYITCTHYLGISALAQYEAL